MSRTHRRLVLAACIALGLACAVAAQAQTAGSETERNVDQQQRIEQGLDSGQLNTKETSQLERGEQRIDRTEARDLRNGSLSPAEKAQIQREQNHESGLIYKDKHNATTGKPNSPSSLNMQADVQRDVNQEQRIHNGVKNDSLTNREVSHLQGREAHIAHEEAAAGRNGRVGAGEQYRIQRTENRDSGRIYRAKHNGRARH